MHPHLKKALLPIFFAAANPSKVASAAIPPNLFGELSIAGTATLAFSGTFAGAVNTVGVTLHTSPPAAIDATMVGSTDYFKKVNWTVPLSQGYFENNGSSTIKQLHGSYVGALHFATPVDKDGFGAIGGQLTISNLDVDLSSQKIYGDVVGHHGMGSYTHMPIWRFSLQEGTTDHVLAEGAASHRVTLKGLTIEAGMFSIFVESLGMTLLGEAAFRQVTDFGQLTLSQSISPLLSPTSAGSNVHVSVVPEPGTSAVFSLGLGLMTLMMRYRKARGSDLAPLTSGGDIKARPEAVML